MNRRGFFRTLFGTLAALPIARLFGWPEPPTVDIMGLDWLSIIPTDPVFYGTIIDPPAGMYVVGVDCAAIDDDCTTITVYGSDGRRAVTYNGGLTWTELDATD